MLKPLVALFCLAASASAATLPWQALPQTAMEATNLDLFAEIHTTFPSRYRGDGQGIAGPDFFDVAIAIMIFLGISGVVTRALPRDKRQSHRKSHASRAASAISRIRVTIARSPLDRWAERLLSNSRRASSAAASVASTSRTGKPS